MSRTLHSENPTTHQNYRGTGDGIERAKDDLSNSKNNVKDAARSGASEIRQGMHDAVEAGKETLQGAKDLVREGYEETKDAACAATNSLRNVVTENPVASISIAAGAGLLLGSILVWRLRG
jgi:ElaB/YqjD/DUF883 family membrane-anchored ribosome-binding protein